MFLRFWPVYIVRDSLSTETILQFGKNLFYKLYAKSPVSAYFDVEEKPNSRVDRKTILVFKVMPWHLAPQSESNSLEDPFDKEDIMVFLNPLESVKQYNEKYQSPFIIRYVNV